MKKLKQKTKGFGKFTWSTCRKRVQKNAGHHRFKRKPKNNKDNRLVLFSKIKAKGILSYLIGIDEMR